jgi:hypothetical protein
LSLLFFLVRGGFSVDVVVVFPFVVVFFWNLLLLLGDCLHFSLFSGVLRHGGTLKLIRFGFRSSWLGLTTDSLIKAVL